MFSLKNRRNFHRNIILMLEIFWRIAPSTKTFVDFHECNIRKMKFALG